MNSDLEDYKKIIEKYRIQLSNEEIIEIVKNIQEMADVFVKFAKNKNQKRKVKINKT